MSKLLLWYMSQPLFAKILLPGAFLVCIIFGIIYKVIGG
jgi:hypothetical protein